MTTGWWCSELGRALGEYEADPSRRCLACYPIGDEPGVDVLPDGREVTVEMGLDSDFRVVHRVGDGPWRQVWFDGDDGAGVRLLAGLKP